MPDLIDQIQEFAQSFDDAVGYSQWGSLAFYRELKGCNFLIVTKRPNYLEMMVRLPKSIRERVLDYPNVEPNNHHGYRGWVNVKISNEAELDAAKEWIGVSYLYNKPVRHQEDLLEGESAEVLAFLDEVRKLALSFGDVEEFFPYGDRAFRVRNGKIFLYASDSDDYLNVRVLLPTGLREYALRQPYVEIPKYIGHKGWISAKVSNAQEFETVLSWIETSFEMNQPPRKKSAKKAAVKE